MRLLVVEDERALAENLREQLRKAGFAVDVSLDGEDGLFNAMEIDYDAAVVDVGLPKLDGIELVKQLREHKSTPILLLTARDHWKDKVAGLNAGADDYLAKPFQQDELNARIAALIRRNKGQTNPILRFNSLCVDTTRSAVSVDDQPITLTAFEYKTLEYLVRHPERVISKTELIEHLYEEDSDRDPNVIEVFIKRLRQKLSPQSSQQFIATVRGQGYRFVVEQSVSP